MATRKFFLMLVGGLIIQSAVVVKNSLEVLKMSDMKIEMGVKGAFVFGWMVVAYSIAIRGNTLPLLKLSTLLAIVGAVAIVLGVFHIKESKKFGKEPQKMMAMLFPGGWVMICLAILFGKSKNRMFAILGIVLVLGSMMFVLPYQRKKCLVDGPGYPMFINAWWILAIANN